LTLHETLVDVWRQVLVEGRTEAEVDGVRRPIGRTRTQGLRMVSFSFRDHAIEGIEQNPEKPSRWGALAREGKRIMQFSCRGRYFANVCDGSLLAYPAWRALALPD
jgi:hypothetical protein